MIRKTCYIDRQPCTGGRFSFCGKCGIAQKENADEIRMAKTPLEITAAHIPGKNQTDKGSMTHYSQPDCYKSNHGVYPLCVGRGDSECEHCCLYEDMPGPYDKM